jgi:SAM-dependent methyltransferase
VRCATAELPFIDAAFRVVVLYHVIASGEEPELPEACRVLAPGGDLVIVGLNHCGWTGFDAGAFAEVPRLHPARVRRRLRHMGMVLAGHFGAGLLGRNRPGVLAQTWQRPIVSVADVVLLHARHANRPSMTVARLKDVPVGLAPTAFAGP